MTKFSSRLLVASLAAAGLAVIASAPAQAGSATANLNVSATVVTNCRITTNDLGFGNYDPIGANAASPLQKSGSVVVACTQKTAPTVGLDTGKNAAGAVRNMKGGTGADLLPYEIYQPVSNAATAACAYTTVWGNAGGALLSLTAAPSLAARTYNVCGQIAAAQDVPAGTYNDVVIATVNF
jgi:spore coat protein U-like protein